MKCPVCGKEVGKDSKNCIYCGASLFGPRSINLDFPESNNNPSEVPSDSIKKITGIDISSLPTGDIPTEPKKKKFSKKNFNKFLDIFSKVMMALSILLFIASIIIYIKDKKNKPTCPEITCPEIASDYKGSAGSLSFILPNEYQYYNDGYVALISNGNVDIVFNNVVNVDFATLTSDKLITFYKAKGYMTASYLEDAINNQTIKLIQFSSSNRKFLDFYYGLDDKTVVMGQLSADEGEILTSDVKSIIASLELIDREKADVNRVVIDYEDLFKR